jgi:hypothetical protein
MTPDIPELKTRLDDAQIALDEAIVTRLTSEPWRISQALGGPSVWPTDTYTTLGDHLQDAELEHRWRIRLYGYEEHPRVRPIGLVVDALLRMMA